MRFGAKKDSVLLTGNIGLIRITEPSGGFDEGLKHFSQVKRRTADDLQHVGGCGLLLERLTQLAEQPRVLDGDDGLIGKGRRQLDLFFSKWLRHGLHYENYPYNPSFVQEWDTERGSVAADLLSFIPSIVGVSQHIGNVNHFTVQGSSPGDAAAIRRHLPVPEIFPDLCVDIGRVTVAGNPVEKLALTLEEPGVISAAQPRHRFDQRIEHRLQVESRTADNLKHI